MAWGRVLRRRSKALKPIITVSSSTIMERGTGGGSGGAGEATAAGDVETEEALQELGEPLSPGARLFHAPLMNCCIIAIIGSKTKIDVDSIMDGLKNSLIKHPRFCSKLVIDSKKGKKPSWVRTRVNLDNHITIPDLDPGMDSPDQFVEDYVSDLTKIPMDISKPLWEVHLLNVKTSDAEAIIILKMHHSLGDGISLISLLLACTRKASDPEAVPSLPVAKKTSLRKPSRFCRYMITIWLMLNMMWNTLIHSILFLATMLFLKDTDTPIKGAPGTEQNPRRIVHRIVSLDDIKMVKNEMNMTINDVILGITQAGLSRYLNKMYGGDDKAETMVIEERDYLPKNIRLRATLIVNVRPSTEIKDLADMMEKGSDCRWGNAIGYILLPFHIALLNDPLDYLHRSKAVIDRKKLSLEAKLTHYSGKLVLKTLGPEVAAACAYKTVANTTMSFSNVVGPAEEISFYGHQLAYIAPTVYGHPQALTIHFQSHADKMTIVVAVDESIIPDPRRLCDDLVESVGLIKAAIIQRRLRSKDDR
ncbi:hypothetical protein Nepgr_021537 [Nepenthes gracilis]|uniref:Diacylglycerol O-acyltransferase n=1 Tax=Nepenthes gracilis TaxID=150966 RepID=A0AAD3XXG6_NEPGR|nr:hypothetical protein Nepgr_021537 [Nepenthes gracilis]